MASRNWLATVCYDGEAFLTLSNLYMRGKVEQIKDKKLNIKIFNSI